MKWLTVALATMLFIFPAFAQASPSAGEWSRSIAVVSSDLQCPSLQIRETRIRLLWQNAAKKYYASGFYMIGEQVIPTAPNCEPKTSTAIWEIGGVASKWPIQLRAIFGTCTLGDCGQTSDLGSRELILDLTTDGSLMLVDQSTQDERPQLFAIDSLAAAHNDLSEYKSVVQRRRQQQAISHGSTLAVMREVLLSPTITGFDGFVSVARLSPSPKTILTEIVYVEGPSTSPRAVHYWSF